MRSFHRYMKFVGAAKHAGLLGFTVAAIWYGCAGTNTDYQPTEVDLGGGGTVGDAGVPPVDPGCVKLPDEDVPDDSGKDSNCDGIDGDASRAIFVAPEGKDSYLGTPENPVQTIAKAIELAVAANVGTAEPVKVAIYMSKGDYNESVTLSSGISLYGGYDALKGWARSATSVARIVGVNSKPAVSASGINAATHLELLQIKAADGSKPSESSYGLFAVNSQGPIIVRNARIQSGVGSNGADGTSSVAGGIGRPGGDAQNACKSCQSATTGDGGSAGTSDCGDNGGKGGNGGYDGDGLSGGTGLGNSCTVVLNGVNVPGGTPGGGGGRPSCGTGSNPNRGGNGAPGCPGGSGQPGTPAAAIGTANVSGYQPAGGGSGTRGTNGGGAGGGGGGSGGPDTGFPTFCNGDEGAGGGSGGGGGCGATAGIGGGGGGASVAVYAYASKLTVLQTDLVAGKGGSGGKGGNGAYGGTGGTGKAGGSSADDGGTGGTGGTGGNGGNSGAGSGGSGGPSYGIWKVNGSTVDVPDTQRITVDPSGGFGGAAGLDPNRGAPGQTVQAAPVQTS